tara:strand:- start:34 stop:1401 length:1368 start_codon:yes stop_codon:yes gene_type:complete
MLYPPEPLVEERGVPPGWVEEEQATPNEHSNAAEAAAAAEGLTLYREAGTPFGYYGVSSSGARFKAQVRDRSGCTYLGTFDSPEGAALAIARRFPRLAEQRAAAAAQRMEAAAPSDLAATMTAERAAQIAEAEGLTLPVNPQAPCGYKGVHHKTISAHRKGFSAHLPGENASRYVGCFGTPHAAALAIARKLGPAASAALAQERRNCAGWLMTELSEMSAPEARRLAKEEGLTLRYSHGQPKKLWGVWQSTAVSERWVAQIRSVNAAYVALGAYEAMTGGGLSPATAATKDESTARSGRCLGAITPSGCLNLGSFASAEAAALALARRLRDDPALAARVQDLQQKAVDRANKPVMRNGCKRRRTCDTVERASGASGARPPSWLLPSDHAAWCDEQNRDECSDDPRGLDDFGDDHNDAEGGEVEVQEVEVEVWSDGDDGADVEDITWVEAELLIST